MDQRAQSISRYARAVLIFFTIAFAFTLAPAFAVKLDPCKIALEMIPADHISNLRPLSEYFVDHPLLRAADYDGRTIVIKFPRQDKVESETFFIKLLSDLNMGPKVLGFVKIEGRFGVAMERIRSPAYMQMGAVGFLGGPRFQINSVQTGKTIAEVTRNIHILTDLEIYLSDFQMLITPEGRAVIIDPEYFTKGVETPEVLREHNQREIENVIRAIRSITQ